MVDLGTRDPHTAFTMGEFEEFEPRLFSEPEVRLIGETMLFDGDIDKAFEDLGITYTIGEGQNEYQDSEELAEIAGRTCYVSFNPDLRRPTQEGKSRNQTYLDHIKETKHGSVTEHAMFNFLLWDISRNMTHELVRHRVGVAYSQLSTRYVDQFMQKYFGNSGHTVGTYFPPEAMEDPIVYEAWKDVLDHQIKAYYLAFHRFHKGLGYEKKRARSVARHILGGNSGTMMVFSVNARELNHIFDMRGSLFADDEIRRMTLKIFDALDAGNRALFNHWEKKVHDDGREFLAVRVLQPATS